MAVRRGWVTTRPASPRCARPARSDPAISRPASTASVCSPSAGPIHSLPPGVADSLGTTPGMRQSRPSGSVTVCSISRARNCGSANMSATE